MGELVDMNGKSLEKKPLEKTDILIISYPIMEVGNGSVHVHKETFDHVDEGHLLGLIGEFITKLGAKDPEGKLMIFPLAVNKFVGVQEKLARINNLEAKEDGKTQS